jgi:endo-1,4-beta-xylanase
VAAQLSMITPENALKPQFLHPQPGLYEFLEGDALVDFAAANGIAVHAHTLVWHESLPPWMHKVSNAAAVKQMMLDHIDHVAGHYRGRVVEWDVINEPMSDEDSDYANGHQGVRPNLWFKAMGESYIDLALQRTHAVDPAAKLYINEYGIEEAGDRWDAFYALVQRLVKRGVPLDGVGFQNHEYSASDRTPPAVFAAHVRALAQLGLSVRVSEMDVLIDKTSQRRIQANEYAGKLTVCRDAPNCTSFSSWGLSDRYGSTADLGSYPPASGDALWLDDAMQPKAAFTASQKVLRRQ